MDAGCLWPGMARVPREGGRARRAPRRSSAWAAGIERSMPALRLRNVGDIGGILAFAHHYAILLYAISALASAVLARIAGSRARHLASILPSIG